MREFNDAITDLGVRSAAAKWERLLARFASTQRYKIARWSGDLFDKSNPLWQRIGVVKPSRDGKGLTVLNTGAARAECGRVLRQLVLTTTPQSNLTFLTRR